jgi:hypothetical protein
MTLADIQALHEPYAYLYVGDYFADTLDLSVREHRALRLLLLETWVKEIFRAFFLSELVGREQHEACAVRSAMSGWPRRPG